MQAKTTPEKQQQNPRPANDLGQMGGTATARRADRLPFRLLTPEQQEQARARFFDAGPGDGKHYELDLEGVVLCRRPAGDGYRGMYPNRIAEVCWPYRFNELEGWGIKTNDGARFVLPRLHAKAPRPELGDEIEGLILHLEPINQAARDLQEQLINEGD